MPEAVLGSLALPSSSASPECSTHLQELASDSGAQHWEAVDSLRFLAGGRLASKSLDGRMLVWDTARRLQLASWKVSPAFAGRYHCTPTTADSAHLQSCCLTQLPPVTDSHCIQGHM